MRTRHIPVRSLGPSASLPHADRVVREEAARGRGGEEGDVPGDVQEGTTGCEDGRQGGWLIGFN